MKKKTTRRKNNKKTKKNKTLIGGRPKINFPYTYFIIDKDTFNNTTLNRYLNIQTNACRNISSGNKPVFNPLDSPLSLNEEEMCIICLKYDDSLILNDYIKNRNSDINNENNSINDLNFLNKILGHAKLIYYKESLTIGIFDVCLHPFNIFEKESHKVTYEPKEIVSGYGTVLFNCIYTGILSLNNIVFDTIWLGIDVKNTQFEKVAWLYTSKGFSNPIVSNITPDGKIVQDIYFIQLTNNKTYVNNNDDALIPYHETIDLYNQIRIPDSPFVEEGIFSFNFKFDKTALLSLRLMPFLSFTESKDVVGIEDYSLQRETAGRFFVYKTIYDDNKKLVNYVLSLETNGQSIKYAIGEVSSVEFIEGERVFHTHPYLNYINYETLIGPPSGQDIKSFFLSITQNPTNQPTQFSSVISIEGIYIISLSIDGIRTLKQLRELSELKNKDKMEVDYEENEENEEMANNISNEYEYPMESRYYDWTNNDTNTTTEVDEVPNAIRKYLTWFNNEANVKFNNLFQLQFISWNELSDEKKFKFIKIYYSNGNRIHVKRPPPN